MPEKESNVPNLDACTEDQLRDFALQHEQGDRHAAVELFPDRPKSFVKISKDLGHYARNKLTAMQQRKLGRVERAIKYEEICDRIYHSLPSWARWP